jgi:hypothetical protein
MKIKEAPVFLIIGFVIGVMGFVYGLTEYIKAVPIHGWLNESISTSVVYLFIVWYFAHNLSKAMEEKKHDDENRPPRDE